MWTPSGLKPSTVWLRNAGDEQRLIDISIYLSISIYLYLSIYIHLSIYIYIYTYTHIYTHNTYPAAVIQFQWEIKGTSACG